MAVFKFAVNILKVTVSECLWQDATPALEDKFLSGTMDLDLQEAATKQAEPWFLEDLPDFHFIMQKFNQKHADEVKTQHAKAVARAEAASFELCMEQLEADHKVALKFLENKQADEKAWARKVRGALPPPRGGRVGG